MQILSASEAIGPAWECTKEVLLVPFDFKRFMKLTAVATLAAMGSGLSFNFPGGSSSHGASHALPVASAAMTAAVVAAMGLLLLVLSLLLVYFGSRMQFVLFEVVARRDSIIGPLWRKYGPSTWRWIGLKMLFLIAIVAGVMLTMLPVILSMMNRSGATQSPMQVARHILPGVVLGVSLALILLAAYLLALDFALPVIALEDASLATAMGRVRSLVEAYPGDVLLYLLVKIFLGIALAVVVGVAVGVSVAAAAIPLVVVGVALFLLLHHAGLMGHILLTVAGMAGLGVFVACVLCLYIAVAGYAHTFWQALALYFYGGRYPLLGNLLEPPVVLPEPPPTTAPDGVW